MTKANPELLANRAADLLNAALDAGQYARSLESETAYYTKAAATALVAIALALTGKAPLGRNGNG